SQRFMESLDVFLTRIGTMNRSHYPTTADEIPLSPRERVGVRGNPASESAIALHTTVHGKSPPALPRDDAFRLLLLYQSSAVAGDDLRSARSERIFQRPGAAVLRTSPIINCLATSRDVRSVDEAWTNSCHCCFHFYVSASGLPLPLR